MLIQQQETISMLTGSHAMMGNPVHQIAGNRLGLGMGIELLLRQDMPDRDQQL
jgi:hypothetical protein